MEDHKKKNKKKNQNKRPTQEQLKKIQNNVEQRKDKVNGHAPMDIMSGTTSSNESKNTNPMVLKVGNNMNGELNGNDKKAKKKNKQKGKLNDKGIENKIANGQEVEETNTGKINEKQKEKTEDSAAAPSNVIQPDALASAIENVMRQSNEAPNCSAHHNDNVKVADFKVNFNVQKHVSPMTSSQFCSNQEFIYTGFNVNVPNSTRGAATVNAHQINTDGLNDINEATHMTNGHIEHEIFPNIATPRNSLESNNEFLQSINSILKDGEATEVPITNNPIQFQNIFDSLNKVQGQGLNESVQNEKFSTNALFRNVFGSEEAHSQNKDVFFPSSVEPNVPDLSNVFNAIKINPAHLDPTLMMNSMSEMMANVDPNIMMNQMNHMMANMNPAIMNTMNSMVANLMQGGSLQDTLQSVMEMKQNMEKESSAAVISEFDEVYENKDATTKSNEQETGAGTCNILKYNTPLNEIIQSNTEEKILQPTIDSEVNLKFEQCINVSDKKEQVEEVNVSNENVETETLNETERQIKSTFSLSSDSTEKSEEENSQVGDVPIEINIPRKVKRFEREQSIPELIDSLINVDKKTEEPKETREIKSNKFRTILSKVLKKDKKSDNNTYVTSFEFHEHRVEYKSSSERKSDNKTRSVNEVDYEKLQHVKEPLEINVRESDKTSKKIKSLQGSRNSLDKGKKTTCESSTKSGKETPDSYSVESISGKIDDYVEFNPENVNELFTTLLQGKTTVPKRADEEIIRGDDDQVNASNPLANLMENMNNLFGGLVQSQKEEPREGDSSSNFANENINPLNMMEQNMPDLFSSLMQQQSENTSKEDSKKSINFQTLMSQMLSTIPQVGQSTSIHEASCSGSDQNNGVQNFQCTIREQMSKIGSGERVGPPPLNLFTNMGEMFEQMLAGDKSSDPNVENINSLLGKSDNLADILKMGEMIFGQNPLDSALDEESVHVQQNLDPEDVKSNEGTKTEDDKNCQSDNEVKENKGSKNMFHEERPSVLLKQLLGEKFWSIKKKRNDLIESQTNKDKMVDKKFISTKNTKGMDLTDATAMTDIGTTCAKELTPSLNFGFDIDKESTFVKKLHNKIQKDTKLQNYLKEKLKKDPKMQKFIQEKLQKDERLQKFIREKLSKDKALRQTFEDKFKNELGLTNVIPKFGDDEDGDEQCGKNNINKSPVDGKSLTKETDDVEENSKNGNKTALLLKKYAELTLLMCGIVYMGIICYI